MTSERMPPDPTATLDALRQRRPAPLGEVLELFDSLPAVALDELRGDWRGGGLETGHPLDGLLELFGWHGKRFGGPEDAHALVMDGPRGTFALDPTVVPVGVIASHDELFRRRWTARAARALMPLLATRRPTARLRVVEHRGVATATMVYDRLPVNDHFRAVDEETLLGCMDLRGRQAPFMFVLEREGGR